MNTTVLKILLQHITNREICAAAIILTLILIGAIWLIRLCGFLSDRVFHKQWPFLLRAFLVFVCAGGVFLYACHAYLKMNVTAGSQAGTALMSNEAVIVHKIDEGYFFDGWGSDKAIIFYGEDRIEETAYAPLLNRIAMQGVDCFLITMPFQRAYLHEDAADAVRNRHSYYRWYMAAHGNAMETALHYVNKHQNQFDGLISFGAYPKQRLSDSLSYIGIYGQNDKLSGAGGYDPANLPEKRREATIRGANHSGFGDFGKLEFDGQASISSSLQQQLAAEMVRLALIGMN
ncbi:MAG: hypothetical protein IKG55_07325 [Solobacterium sp.]|nr:hypothetical protein [Solobacterium sp.]